MKVSRIKVEPTLEDIETGDLLVDKKELKVSDIETAIVDESRGLHSKWQVCLVAEKEEGSPNLPLVDYYYFNISLLNFKDFQNENVVAFGTAYVYGGYDIDDQTEEDLPLCHLNKLENEVVWRFDVRLDLEQYQDGGSSNFHAEITLIYFEPTKLQADLMELFECKMHSDVVLVASDQENFEVHKNILSARSLVFRRMFENDMKEKQEGKVEIEDIRGPVLGEMLRFMYTEKLPSVLEPGILEDLYVAADKYDVSDLKEIVVEKLQLGISAENVKERLAVAEDLNLKEKCLSVMNEEPGALSSGEA